MKKLIIIRHAKSSWDDISLSDRERPLNKRGIESAKKMGAYLKGKHIKEVCFISSPAKRAYDTAVSIAHALYEKPEILIQESLYTFHDNGSVFINLARTISNQFETLILFSHNETCYEFVQEICPEEIDAFPTCAVACFKADVTDWEEISKDKLELEFFQIPKKL